MAFFSSGSRVLVEILTRMQSAERPMPVDHTFFEFGSIRYHVEASVSDPENVFLSISTPSLSHEAAAPSSSSAASRLPELTLQETRKTYGRFAEIVEPPREGYALTLKLNFSGLARPKDRVKAINQVSLLQSVVLSSQLKEMLGSLGSSPGTMRLVYNQREPFFVSRTADETINAIFPMRFRDDTDLAIATSFFQELQDVGNSFAWAPKCSWSPIPPPELRGEKVHHLTTNGGFVSFGVLSRHVRGKRAAKTAWILLNFQSYVKYHIKCTRSHVQSRMRERLETLTEAVQNARLRGTNSHDKKRASQVVKKRSSKRRLVSLAKASKKLHKGFRAVLDKIMKRLRQRIRVKGLDRLRRQFRCRCFAVPRLPAAPPRAHSRSRKAHRYHKLAE
ncbi:actin-related protein 2/3 complex subunit 2B isoform X1 [Sorghum bicolor]|uniref:Arp2/3 complex 34 kDa subunit n=1 Tax=Sorghum bicolor TaxID=4558 RepID=C5YC00_SORBI|nr:actin-related protein 2/3 complex subunit 2B isoform X1 [Sorghum bicolor]EES12487.2 hypothetical protein SORBI_3006G144600 [Sorghum bicolor]|eukprot:XP_021318908.1 actin-related protein 2/3 complex subunit 2B isoform X1 [Sorghum bicolor]